MSSTPDPKHPRIVVGYAHTPAGTAALRWAVLEAQRTGGEVVAVHVFDVDRRADAAMTTDQAGLRSDARRLAQHRIHQAVADLGPAAPIRFTALVGDVAEMLAATARQGDRLVLGEPATRSDASLPVRLSRGSATPVTVVSETGTPRDVPDAAAGGRPRS